jgi:MYXO-CTERM domain-containing protein
MSSAVSREVLEERIEREKAALAEALSDLRERARAQVKLSNRVREKPSAWLAGAVVLGFLFGVRR